MTKTNTFQFAGLDLRSVTIEGKPWFVAVDACRILGLTNTTVAVKPLDATEKTLCQIKPLAGPYRLTSVVGCKRLASCSEGRFRPHQEHITMNMMTTITSPFALAISEVEGEPLVLDTALGEALGMAQPRDIRGTIAKHIEALETFGSLRSARANPGPKGGRPSTAYWLNEEQAVYVTMHCKTERAQAVKVEIVRVFTAWRRGVLVPVQPAIPNFADPIEAAQAWIEKEQARCCGSPYVPPDGNGIPRLLGRGRVSGRGT